MPAAALRVALERNPTLRETLLHEKRASRLRSVPLFECLDDEDINWLTLLTHEKSYAAGEQVALDQDPGLCNPVSDRVAKISAEFKREARMKRQQQSFKYRGRGGRREPARRVAGGCRRRAARAGLRRMPRPRRQLPESGLSHPRRPELALHLHRAQGLQRRPAHGSGHDPDLQGAVPRRDDRAR